MRGSVCPHDATSVVDKVARLIRMTKDLRITEIGYALGA